MGAFAPVNYINLYASEILYAKKNMTHFFQGRWWYDKIRPQIDIEYPDNNGHICMNFDPFVDFPSFVYHCKTGTTWLMTHTGTADIFVNTHTRRVFTFTRSNYRHRMISVHAISCEPNLVFMIETYNHTIVAIFYFKKNQVYKLNLRARYLEYVSIHENLVLIYDFGVYSVWNLLTGHCRKWKRHVAGKEAAAVFRIKPFFACSELAQFLSVIVFPSR
jgi:hypothetical protein